MNDCLLRQIKTKLDGIQGGTRYTTTLKLIVEVCTYHSTLNYQCAIMDYKMIIHHTLMFCVSWISTPLSPPHYYILRPYHQSTLSLCCFPSLSLREWVTRQRHVVSLVTVQCILTRSQTHSCSRLSQALWNNYLTKLLVTQGYLTTREQDDKIDKETRAAAD